MNRTITRAKASAARKAQLKRIANRAKLIERIADNCDQARAEQFSVPTQSQLDEWWSEPEVFGKPRDKKVENKDERRYRGSRATEDKTAIVRRQLVRLLKPLLPLPKRFISEAARRLRNKLDLPPEIPKPSARTVRRHITQFLKER